MSNMEEWIGQTIGQYRIEGPLDAGGMGQVFRGMHVSLHRPAAIKIMRADLEEDPTFRGRFLIEAQSAAALHHPNIVKIYDFNEHNGHLYLVMELMTAGSLSTLLRRRVGGQPWSLTLGLDLARQAAEGLAAAHAQNMVHRDIKPDNLLLNRVQGAAGTEQYQLKIGDFGLAKITSGNVLTIAGATMGTLAYMSPEQCQGGTLDGRSDLYSLGVVLYLITTGYHPFQINTFEDAMQKHGKLTPEPPRSLRPDVPAFIEEIILRCLAKRPEERYATGSELAQALRTALGNQGLATVLPIHLPSPAPVDPIAQHSRGTGKRTPVPNAALLPGGAGQPRVHVLDQSGHTLQVVEITGGGIIIGRQIDSTIVLPEQAVSRQHLRVTWDGKQVSVTDLGSSNGTLLGEQRLQPRQSQEWKPGQTIRLGSYWLQLEGVRSQAGTPLPAGTPQSSGRDTSLLNRSQQAGTIAGGGRIGIVLEQEKLIITPGQPSLIQVTLLNMGTIVDWFTVTAEGVAPEWVQGPEQVVQLNPNSEQAVALTVHVVRAARNRAGDYPVTIRARSREKPGESVVALTHWTVLPFTEDSLHIEPRRASGRGKAAYTVVLGNDGNTPTRHALSGDDDEQKLTYRFAQTEAALEPEGKKRVPLQVKARRHWLGREQRQQFQIYARSAGTSNRLSASGEFVNKAVLPGWALSLVGIVLVAGLALALLLPKYWQPGQLQSNNTPTTPLSSVTPTVPMPIVINWNAHDTGISKILYGVAASETGKFVAVGESGTILTSTDGGNTWVPASSVPPNTGSLMAVIWASSRYIAVGYAGTILISTDGDIWTPATSVPSNINNLQSVVWSGKQYVIVGNKCNECSSGIILTSTDGNIWTSVSSIPQDTNALASVTWSGQMFIAVGGPIGAQGNGTILVSTDGSNWISRVSHTESYLRSVTWSGEQYIAVGNSGVIDISIDGSNWMLHSMGDITSNFGVVFHSGSQYVLAGQNGLLFISTDGFTWKQQVSNTKMYLRAITKWGSQYIIVGAQGIVLTSQ